MTRFVILLGAAVLLGGVVAVVADEVFYPTDVSASIGFWGWVDGSVVGLTTLGVLLAAFSGSVALRRGGAILLCLVLALAAWVLFWFIFAWGVIPPWSLEGMWMWPLAVGSATGTILALRWAVRIR